MADKRCINCRHCSVETIGLRSSGSVSELYICRCSVLNYVHAITEPQIVTFRERCSMFRRRGRKSAPQLVDVTIPGCHPVRVGGSDA